MDASFISDFVNKLIEKTLTGQIKWYPLFESMKVDDSLISDYLNQDEFHIIHYLIWNLYDLKTPA